MPAGSRRRDLNIFRFEAITRSVSPCICGPKRSVERSGESTHGNRDRHGVEQTQEHEREVDVERGGQPVRERPREELRAEGGADASRDRPHGHRDALHLAPLVRRHAVVEDGEGAREGRARRASEQAEVDEERAHHEAVVFKARDEREEEVERPAQRARARAAARHRDAARDAREDEQLEDEEREAAHREDGAHFVRAQPEAS
mmetsp:Transcript_19024/g.40485  ORF Transcript_19024/g.40485 Transcript_19024/m.40485 type:complete len:203 (-) Transcript_19024:59-667(-)